MVFVTYWQKAPQSEAENTYISSQQERRQYMKKMKVKVKMKAVFYLITKVAEVINKRKVIFTNERFPLQTPFCKMTATFGYRHLVVFKRKCRR